MNTKVDVLVITPVYAPTLEALEREFNVFKLWAAPDPKRFLQDIAARVRGAVTTGLVGFNRGHLEALPKVEIVACWGVGHGTLDLAAARERGVIVTNTPDSSAAAVADLAMGLILAVMRRICECDRFVRAGKWLQGGFPLGSAPGNKTCGVIGLGNIGREVAKRAQAFGMKVCYHGPRQKPDVPYPYYADLEAMARDADCLVVTCPGIPATRNLVDARILRALGPQGFLVNVARGSVVDEPALITALRDKQIAGAALDVFSDEPRVPRELIHMEQVVLAAHIGTSTREIRQERHDLLFANLRAHFAGKPVPTPVARE